MQFIDFAYRGKYVDIPGCVLKVPLQTTWAFVSDQHGLGICFFTRHGTLSKSLNLTTAQYSHWNMGVTDYLLRLLR